MDYSIFDRIPLGICLMDRDFTVRGWNICMQDWTGITLEEIRDQDIRVFFPLFNRKIYASRLKLLFNGGPPAIFSPQLHAGLFPSRKQGMPPQVHHITVSSINTDEGEVLALFAVQDVTREHNRSAELRRLHQLAREEIVQRRKAEEELTEALDQNRTLMRENQHRIKNNLATLISLLELQKNNLFDPRDEEILTLLVNRVYSIQQVHKHLSENADTPDIRLDAYLKDLADNMINAGAAEEKEKRPEVQIHADPVELKIKTAIPVGMIIAELITNSLKHSFGSSRETQNTISISTQLDTRGMLTLRYRDSGDTGGEPREGGLGIRLNEAFADQLGGSLRREPEMGNVTVLEFPLKQQ
ncbi:histidine kinase dimerization/phosphoacceptor domain -containing protein [Marispirochaeta aestuarii]|uniref:sensor histidine kinase n=1 Tax=Marispirochaeta aestuarii TaxID=1963862 RepID=UPI0029C692EA|nr:histidine kinase dimerization/phosphoacceptor domain -containing protein [Marispirochaeta aestuarii]